MRRATRGASVVIGLKTALGLAACFHPDNWQYLVSGEFPLAYSALIMGLYMVLGFFWVISSNPTNNLIGLTLWTVASSWATRPLVAVWPYLALRTEAFLPLFVWLLVMFVPHPPRHELARALAIMVAGASAVFGFVGIAPELLVATESSPIDEIRQQVWSYTIALGLAGLVALFTKSWLDRYESILVIFRGLTWLLPIGFEVGLQLISPSYLLWREQNSSLVNALVTACVCWLPIQVAIRAVQRQRRSDDSTSRKRAAARS